MAIHLEPFYRARLPDLSLPVTERAAADTLLLPLYVGMTDAEQAEVIGALQQALDGHGVETVSGRGRREGANA